jgi:hypothetical protein
VANRISIDDTTLGVGIRLSASGSYAPDVMTDLVNRARDLYQEAAAYKHALYMNAAVDIDDTED